MCLAARLPRWTWKPEFAKSWEAGVKTELLDGKLRANLAVFSVTYENLQFAQAGATFQTTIPAIANIPTLVVGSRAPARARGFELELTAAPTRGLTLGANLGYTDFKYLAPLNVEVLLTAARACAVRNSGLLRQNSSFRRDACVFAAALAGVSACEVAQSPNFRQTLLPKITSNLWAQWESEPLWGSDTRLTVRLDAQIKSSMRIDPNIDAPLPGFEAVESVPSTLILNGRIALSDIQMGPVNTTFALWGRNLTDDKHIQFVGGVSGVSRSASFQPARTFGAD